MKIDKIILNKNSTPLIGEDEIEIKLNSTINHNKFWHEKIVSVNAIVGENGSGKSLIMDAIKNGKVDYKLSREGNSNDYHLFYSPYFRDTNEYSNGNFEVIDVSKYQQFQDDVPHSTFSFKTCFNIHESQKTLRFLHFMYENTKMGFIEKCNLALPHFDKMIIEVNIFNGVILHNVPINWHFFFDKDNIKNLLKNNREMFKTDFTEKVDDQVFDKNEIKLYFLKSVINKIHEIVEGGGNRYYDRGRMISNEIQAQILNLELRTGLELFLENAYIDFNDNSIGLPKDEILNFVDTFLNALDNSLEIINGVKFSTSFKDAYNIALAYNKFVFSFMENFAISSSPVFYCHPERILSSGEEAMYNLLATFYDVNYNLDQGLSDRYQIRIENINPEYDNFILILLDEADLGFHPMWKKKFVNTLVSVVPNIFINYKIQILFTTHDPLTLSDLPADNITYLSKENNELKVRHGGMNTFGANVSDLLSNSFFIKDGLIGDFAKNKINEVIHWININKEAIIKSDTFENEKKYYLEIISIIDEPITKIKLSEMMDEIIGNNELKNKAIEEEIEKLKKMIS